MHAFSKCLWERLPLFLEYLKPVLKDMPKEYLKRFNCWRICYTYKRKNFETGFSMVIRKD